MRRSAKLAVPTSSAASRWTQVRNVALVFTMSPSGVVVRKPHGAES